MSPSRVALRRRDRADRRSGTPIIAIRRRPTDSGSGDPDDLEHAGLDEALYPLAHGRGSAGVGLRERRDGYEYIVEWGATARALPALGFNPRGWATIEYPGLAGSAALSRGHSCPRMASPRPDPAYVRSRPDDTFWAARKLMAISDEIIRAAVPPGRTESGLRKIPRRRADRKPRQDGRAWLTAINPVVDPTFAADGR